MSTDEVTYIEPESLLWKFFDNETTEEEKQLILDWVKESEHNKKLFREARTAYIVTRYPDGEKAFDSTNAFADFTKQTERKTISFRRLLLYAACIAAFVGIGFSTWIFTGQKPQDTVTFACRNAQTRQVALPDGSISLLKKSAELIYNTSETKTRTLSMKGQVYFDVVHNAAKPFIINAGDLLIKVLGTRFIVNARQGSDSVIVNVLSGRVLVMSPNASFILSKDQSGIYTKSTKQLTLIDSYDKNDIAWKTNVLYFKATPLSNVAKQLGEYFDTKISVTKEIADYPLTVQLDNPNLDSVLHLLKLSLNLRVHKTDSTIILEAQHQSD